MSEQSASRKAFLNNEHAKVTGNLPDVPINRNNSHRTSWQCRELSTLNTDSAPPAVVNPQVCTNLYADLYLD